MSISLPNLASSVLDNLQFNLAWKGFMRDVFNRVSGGMDIALGGALSVNSTAVGNVGSGEDSLMTYSIPKNTISDAGDVIEIRAFGKFGATANNKTIKLYFGSQVLFATDANAANDGSWEINATVIQVATSSQKASARIDSNNTTVQGDSTYSAQYTAPAVDETDTIIVKCTGEGTADNDIVQHGMIVKFYPAL